MNITKRGYWEGLDALSKHHYDKTLAEELLLFFKKQGAAGLADLGCGLGDYVQYFNINGLNTQGFDGNPNTTELANIRFQEIWSRISETNYSDFCQILDLSKPQKFKQPFDWILSLEIGEHIPKEYEEIFINNIHSNNVKGVVLSWAVVGQGGAGHVNCQDNDYIREKFYSLGYKDLPSAENTLRQAALANWFKNTIMVFKRD